MYKKEVYSHIIPDDDSLTPKEQHIQFLEIDSNDYINGLNKEDEFLYLDGDINW